jgi:hypothetical protein
MKLTFKVHDIKDRRLQKACGILGRLVRKHKLDAEVVAVSEYLEHCRLGVEESLPALQLNGYILGKGFELTQERLEDLCSKLAGEINKSDGK